MPKIGRHTICDLLFFLVYKCSMHVIMFAMLVRCCIKSTSTPSFEVFTHCIIISAHKLLNIVYAHYALIFLLPPRVPRVF